MTASLVDGRVAILVFRTETDGRGLGVWRETLQSRYGSVASRTDHGQEMWQWIRRRQMLRLTTRLEAGRRVASVTLLDGPLLDGLDPPGRP